MKSVPNIELLSPCGSFESLRAAIQAGCNAVYFGVEQLNMRARSSINFSLDDLKTISSIAKKSNIKAYITLNTILYDHDMSLMRAIVDKAKEYGVNAVIAADHAVMNYAKKVKMSVHISTQANITNIDSVEFYAQFADVVVLARELTLEQVKKIVHEIKRRKIKGPSGELLRVEVFVHGALCMAVSGKCYLSLHSHFASANRGACVQNCRRNYLVIDKENFTELEIDNEYIMSAKDLCTIGFLDKILDAGVSVLKIEGRGRSEEYVYTTTKAYREAVDSVHTGSFSKENIMKWKGQLETVFNRGFWDGYYLGKEIGEWNNEYGSKATKRKIYVGKGVKYFDKIAIGEFKIEAQCLQVGDDILISGPTTGVIQDKVSELRVKDRKKEMARRGDVVSLPVKSKIRSSDKLYKVVNV
ncbi:MAG: U32 family peptidase [Bacteroidetes bacterium]|nr:MAG: U32 family peptidase [Bacteroidota bacterium]